MVGDDGKSGAPEALAQRLGETGKICFPISDGEGRDGAFGHDVEPLTQLQYGKSVDGAML